MRRRRGADRPRIDEGAGPPRVRPVRADLRGAPRGRARGRHVFFFQAEDGIRDLTVTGVQTCALPISPAYSAGPAPSSCTASACTRPARPLPTEDQHEPFQRAMKSAGVPPALEKIPPA